MKKFASIVLCFMLVLSMAVTGVVAASAADAAQTGKITIHKNVSKDQYDADPKTKGLAGAEFTIYQVMSLDNNLYHITSDFANAKEFLPVDELATAASDDSGYLTYGNTGDLEAQIAALQLIAKNLTSGTSQETDEYGKAEFTNLPYGVYLVVETKVPDGYTAATNSFLVSLSNNKDADGNIQNDVHAFPKNVTIAVDKNILIDEENNTTQKNTSAAIGDEITYQVTTKVPSYDVDLLNEIKTDDAYRFSKIPFYFIDELSEGLTLKANTVMVTVGDTVFTDKAVKTVSDNELIVSIPFENLYNDEDGNKVNHMGENVTIQYKATLNEKAKVTSGNDNTVTLYYTNAPATFDPAVYFTTEKVDHDTDPETPDIDVVVPKPGTDPKNPPTSVNPTTDPKVFTYEMDITKLLNGKAFEPVDGQNVKFTLAYSDSESGTYSPVKFTGSDGVYKVSAASTATELTVDTDGNLKVVGLKAGYYQLTETQTLDDYNKLSAPVTIIVSEDTNVEGTDVNSGKVIANTYVNGELTELNNDKDGIFNLEVNNSKSQFNLPTTGGLGLWMFTIGGAVVLAAAIFIFVSVRKKKSKD
ncbi:MAG: SpaH/EbpB family LPXTG-anchored major pilin [Ruminococcus sp.]